MERYLFATDLDGSFLNELGEVSPANEEAVKCLKEHGSYFAVATGRPSFRVDYLFSASLKQRIDYLICCNGALIYDYQTKEILEEHLISDELYVYFLQKFNPNDCLLVYTKEHIYAINIIEEMHFLYDLDCVKVTTYEALKDLKDIVKLIIGVPNGKMDACLAGLDEKIKERFNYFASGTNYLEFVDQSINKGKALIALEKHANINPTCTFGIGDQDNDYDLIKAAYFGVAMYNGSPKVKKAAKIILANHCYDGFAGLIKAIFVGGDAYLVSACLLGDNTKYDGNNNACEKVIEFLKDKLTIKICPEVFGGLSVPRIPSEIVETEDGFKVYSKDLKDVTRNFVDGANQVLELNEHFHAKFAILKEGSPSCGVNLIYDGSFKGNKIKGMGITTRILKSNGIKVMCENDL